MPSTTKIPADVRGALWKVKRGGLKLRYARQWFRDVAEGVNTPDSPEGRTLTGYVCADGDGTPQAIERFRLLVRFYQNLRPNRNPSQEKARKSLIRMSKATRASLGVAA